MPTERKVKRVEELSQWMAQCTIAISTDFSGLAVDGMTELRRALREKGVQYRVVKNSLALLASDAAGRPNFKEIIEGPTGIAYWDGEPSELAKALSEFVKSTRSPLTIRGGVMGERLLTADEVDSLATLPSHDELVARLMGQLQRPVAGLAYVLSGPVSGLARVLQRHVESIAEPVETPEADADSVETPEADADSVETADADAEETADTDSEETADADSEETPEADPEGVSNTSSVETSEKSSEESSKED